MKNFMQPFIHVLDMRHHTFKHLHTKMHTRCNIQKESLYIYIKSQQFITHDFILSLLCYHRNTLAKRGYAKKCLQEGHNMHTHHRCLQERQYRRFTIPRARSLVGSEAKPRDSSPELKTQYPASSTNTKPLCVTSSSFSANIALIYSVH